MGYGPGCEKLGLPGLLKHAVFKFSEFIEMGGYAFNVWSVYSMFLIFLTINLYGPLRKNRQIIRDLSAVMR